MRPRRRQGAGVGSDIATEMFMLTDQRLDFRQHRQVAAQDVGALQSAGIGADNHRGYRLAGEKIATFGDLGRSQIGDGGVFDARVLTGGAKDDVEFGLAVADEIHALTPG